MGSTPHLHPRHPPPRGPQQGRDVETEVGREAVNQIAALFPGGAVDAARVQQVSGGSFRVVG